MTDTYTAMLAMQAYMSGALSRRALEHRIGREEAREMLRGLWREMLRATDSATDSATASRAYT